MLVRRIALAAAGLTLVLIVAGGLVTNTDSGLACPDWPTCFGSPMPKMVGGVAVEHTHRLIAAAVGFLTMLLCVLLLARDRLRAQAWLLAGIFAPLVLAGAFWAARAVSKTGELPALPLSLTALGFAGCLWVLLAARGEARLAVSALVLVLAQGLLGGLTVVYKLPPTILVLHLGTSLLFFSTLLSLALRLSPGLQPEGAGPGARALLWLSAGAVYLQILLGATVRHTGAGLICTDLPLCRGALWPTQVHPAVHLHLAHRALALLVAALVIFVSLRLLRTAARPLQRGLLLAAPALVLIQIALGVLTIVTFKQLVPVTAHLLVAALLLGCYVSLLECTRAEAAVAPTPARGALQPAST